jgi:hypothetical protein
VKGLLKKIVSVGMLMLLFMSVLMLTFNIRARALENGVYLFMTPLMHVAEETGELFDVAINISGVENLQNVEFTITYNTSLLDVAQVVQGPFFPSPPKSYFRLEGNESLGFIKVNMSLASSETPRSGDGTLVFISFEVVQGPESCASSPIEFAQTLLLNHASAPINHNFVGAVYFWKSIHPDPDEGRSLDVYTQKGGEGKDQPGGTFALGEEVHLISIVTYNGFPEQQKLVAFQVLDSFNVTTEIRTVITGSDGIAEISLRIPETQRSFGTWTAISVVEIAEKVVWDTSSFRVYLVMPVGGYSFPIEEHTTANPLTPYSIAVLTTALIFIRIRRKTKRI